MNPTNFECPSDISRFVTTDYRPSKALYANVNNNNDFRLYLQQNANRIRQRNLQRYVESMNCNCESRSRTSQRIPPFDSSALDKIEAQMY